MGKIFDALEKADKGTAFPTRKAHKSSHGSRKTEKVVPSTNSKRVVCENQVEETLITSHEPESIEAELFKTLRANILFPTSGQPPKTILVTSALPDDGKTFVSANLAISIADCVEEHVLLIDGDIRKPDMHNRFGFRNVPGLSECLFKGDNVADVLLKTAIDKLTLLPAGKPSSNPAERIASKKVRALFEEVKDRYEDRYIIIDSPSPSMATETNAIAQHVDGIILVVRAGKTPRDAVSNTIEQIGKDKIIGVVLNQADYSSKKHNDYNKSYC